jgi:hypothetical protein
MISKVGDTPDDPGEFDLIELARSRLLSVMRATWLGWSFVLLSATACVPRPDEILEEIRTGAVAAVTGRMDGATTSPLPLRVEANPWGTGFLVFPTAVERIEDVPIWRYCPDLGWSFPPREKHNRLFALNSAASRLTPRTQRFEAADAEAQSKTGLQSRSGLQSQPKRVIEAVVFYAIREDVHVHDAHEAIAGRRGTGPSKTRAP